jgi:phospholipid/cholesterol/gamma-HCH transport system substrate-binding protein
VTNAGRIAAVAALALAAVAFAFLLMGGGPKYTVNARFENSSQLVKGNLVQVAGQTVGKVEDIALTDNGQANVRFTVSDDYAPLKRGTIAVIRQTSLSGIANRYIDLQQGPATSENVDDGGTIEAEDTESTVDIDQLFGIFDPKTRKDTRKVIEGFADMADGRTRQANEALRYLNPALSSSARFFDELSRNDAELERFVVESSRLVTDVADKREDLAGIVRHFGAVSNTLARRDEALAESINRLPGFLRKANTTFVNLRGTLDDLDPLVEASRPVVRDLRPLLADLRPFARDAGPTLRDLSRTIRAPGKDNDLVELMQSQAAVRKIATGPVQANGKERRGALPEATAMLNGSVAPLSFARPYAVDLTGWFDDFSTSGLYDALGSFSRAGLAFSAFTFTPAANPVLQPVPPALRDEALAADSEIGRNNRCPGSVERQAADKTNPYKPSPDFGCDETQTPVGP